jgi:hypothetical protein
MRHFCGVEASGAEFQQGCLPTDHAIQRIVEDTGVNEEIVPVFRERTFADDYICSTLTTQKGLEEAPPVKKVLADAGLNSQRWKSNSTKLLRQMAESAGPKPENIHQLRSNSEEKVLGVSWDTHLDNLEFKVAEVPITYFTFWNWPAELLEY